MVKQHDKQRLLTRRAVMFGGLQLAGLGALAARLHYLQFIRADEYQTLSENNRVKLQLIAPERGHLLDRNGEPMAVNEKNYQLFLDITGLPRKTIVPLLEKIASLVPVTEKQMKKVLDEIRANPYAPPLLVKEHLSWEEVATIELHQLELPGVNIDIGQVRYYPYADHSAHVLGYVGAVAPEDMEDQPLLKLPEFKIGKSGVEKLLENRVRGTAGIRSLEVDVHGVAVRELDVKPGVPGENVRLTLDNRLQEFASQRVVEESAAVIVMDIHTGDILTLASMPGFDPNIFSKGIPSGYWKELHDNIRDPLVNKATQGQYPPGSTFKMMTGLAGLESGVISPGTRVFCPGHFFLGSHRFNCWKPEGHGSVDVHDAIAQSCDTFFYTVGMRSGIDPIAGIGRKFGLGSPTGIGLLSEKGGIMPDEAWKQKRYKQKWQTGDTVNVAIGQGYVLATPLQLCVMAARLVNGGRAVVPRLVKPSGETKPPKFPKIEVDADHLALIKSGMDAVTGSPSGTAYGKRITEPGMEMGGKTGTSQVRKIFQRGMKQELLPWEYRHHGLFVGYAPVHAPKYAIGVIVEHGGGGSAAAAPVAKDVLLKLQMMEKEAKG